MCQPRRAPPWRGWWGAARQRAAPNAFWVSRGRCSRTASVLSLSAPHARARRLSRTSGWHGRAAWPSARLLRRRKVFLSAPTPKTQAGGLRASQAPHGAQPQPRRARARVGWRAGVGGAGALGPPRSALRVALSMECRMSAVAFTLRSLRSVDHLPRVTLPACAIDAVAPSLQPRCARCAMPCEWAHLGRGAAKGVAARGAQACRRAIWTGRARFAMKASRCQPGLDG